MTATRPVASVSLDLDDLWTYLQAKVRELAPWLPPRAMAQLAS